MFCSYVYLNFLRYGVFYTLAWKLGYWMRMLHIFPLVFNFLRMFSLILSVCRFFGLPVVLRMLTFDIALRCDESLCWLLNSQLQVTLLLLLLIFLQDNFLSYFNLSYVDTCNKVFFSHAIYLSIHLCTHE